MAWVYDSPFTKQENDAYLVLKKRLKNYDLAKDTVKLISLTAFLRKQKFKSPSEIQKSAYIDSAKTKPIFNEKTAKQVFQGLKKKGGSDYPFTDFTAKQFMSYVVSFLPDFLEFPVRNIADLITRPVSNLKENIPLFGLALDTIHSGTEIGVTTTADTAEAVAGPIGAAVATPFIAIAGALASSTALLENDVGQAVAHMVNVVPLFGSALGKWLTHIESLVEKLSTNHQTIASYLPLVSTYSTTKNIPAPVAGKRFSTQKHKYTKWRKTRRNKSAKV